MAEEVRCPMCSKPNRPNADVCEFCGARITPVTAPLDTIKPGETPTPKKTSDLERTLPGWLRDARKAGTEQDDFSDQAEESGDDQGLTDSSTPEPQPESQDSRPAEPQSPLDFLTGLAAGTDDEEETPDWLKNLRADQPEEETTSPAPAADSLQDLMSAIEPGRQAEQPQSDSNEWDFDKQAFDFKEDSQDSSDLPFDAETPDWLTALKNQQADSLEQTPTTFEPENVDVSPAQAGDLPSWLGGLAEDDSASQASPPQPVSPSGQPESTPLADDAPDWLASLSAETPAAPAETPAGGTDDSPDWLASPPAETPAAQAETPAAGADDAPDWLASLSAETPAAQPETLAAGADDAPDWLASLSTETPATEAETPAAGTDDSPDWLTSLSAETPAAEAEPTASAEELPESLAGDMPDWLSQAVDGEPKQEAAPAEKKPKAFQTGSLEEVNLAETPDWLANVAPDSETAAPETPIETASQAEAASEPDALASQPEPVSSSPFELQGEESPSISTSQEDLDAFLSMDVPDWLTGFTPDEQPETAARNTQQAESGDDEDISPASLPSWVQAMRPVESVASDAGLGDEGQLIEQEGPLAGFRAVLPVQAGLSAIHKPSAYSMRLRADDVQQSQAALLDELVRAEQTPRSLPGRNKVQSNRPLRWAIAAILLLVVFLPALFGTQSLPVPAQSTSDLSDFISTVHTLDANLPVLVVMDYQPALAGEMEAAFSPVLNDLMIRGSHLGFISTLPTGPLMVERMITLMQARYGHDYQPGLQYVDMGYLPGDAAGIQSFANRPRTTIGLHGLQDSIWDTPVLTGVEDLNDFAAVIVITDNPDTGRIWVEQAGMVLQDKPMLMVISAQAEPMLRPYYDSRQVRGLVTGLGGGAVYEAIRKQPGLARDYWDGYGFGLLTLQFLILIGGVWSLVSGLLARRKEQNLEED